MASRTVAALPALLFSLAGAGGCGAPPPATAPAPSIVASPPVTTAAAPVPVPAGTAALAPDDASLGQLDFTITGSPECQRRFREGMLALHSFLYDQAHESFTAALVADPRCALAAWGDAMTYDHAIWHERDVTKGRAALARVTGEADLTPKERAYLATARALFAADGAKEAHAAWLVAATAMHRDFPADDEVALQHALALICVHGYDPAHVREQMEAGAIALGVLQRRPDHPGAAHYVIHAFDSPEHAILALPAARTYARIAPAASHALHMPSHTFTHLGMWRDVVPSNERAFAASVAWEKAHGHTAGKYDWHSYAWLVAAHLELGQPAAARKLIDEAAALLGATKDDTGGFRNGYVDIVADYVTQTDRWADVETLVAPVMALALDEGTEGTGPVACAAHAPGAGGEVRLPGALVARMTADGLRAEAAIRAGDEATAVKRVADAKAVRAQMAPWSKMLPPDFTARTDAKAEVLLARAHAGAKPGPAAQKKVMEALEKLERLEVGKSIAGPAWERTTREVLGATLMTAGKPKEALSQFEKDLEARPNRALALLGAARAAKAAGDAEKARGHYAALAELWSGADVDLPGLAEVRAGATGN
jgi:hypothetical protein